jgi:hypothetical protein
MPAWLVEGNATLYFLTACAAAILAGLWWRTRRRKYAVAAGVAGLLVGGVYLLDRAVESPAEQMVRKVNDISAAVGSRDFDRMFRHVSDHFRRGGFDKRMFREFAERVAHQRNVTEFTPWGFEPGPISNAARRGELEFQFKIRGNWSAGNEFFRARTEWVLDPDDEWRIQTFDVFNPYTDSNAPIGIPGWGR